MSGLQPTSPGLRLSTEDARTRPDVLGKRKADGEPVTAGGAAGAAGGAAGAGGVVGNSCVVICSRRKLRLRTEVLTNESNYSLEHDEFVPFETYSRRAYNGSNWVDDCEYIRKMMWPEGMRSFSSRAHEFSSAQALQTPQPAVWRC